jgi:uncharacterized protein YdhG (YjbR/CyaY superfamily)
MAARPKISTVSEYLKLLPPPRRSLLRRVFALIRKSVPGSAPVISYGIPAFKLEKVFIYCAAFKSHMGIYPPVRADARLLAALRPYAGPKGNLRFAFDEPMPYALIARVARSLAKQRDADRGG